MSVNLVCGNRASIAKAKSPVKARKSKREVGTTHLINLGAKSSFEV
ncbi:hypothetical protein [uncultured Campylobacter sp.]|nr:hypothetical protein [uncultured Campylobacter sp.]